MVEMAFAGEVVLDFNPDGLVWQLTAPAAACLADSADVTE
jgi:hypothetical protein